MKNKLFAPLLLIIALISFSTNKLSAQAMKEGDMAFTGQYGFPNLFNLILKTAYNNSGYTGLSVKGFGPVGLQYEYMVTDEVGLGVKVNFSQSSLNYKENDIVQDDTGGVHSSFYSYKFAINRFRFMPRFAYHFTNNDNFDGYLGVAAGYSGLSFKLRTQDPAADTVNLKVKNMIPVGFRIEVGGNYYFNEYLGLNFEIGLGGGPIINLGLSCRLADLKAERAPAKKP